MSECDSVVVVVVVVIVLSSSILLLLFFFFFSFTVWVNLFPPPTDTRSSPSSSLSSSFFLFFLLFPRYHGGNYEVMDPETGKMMQVSPEHRTPLFEAVEAGHENMVSCLLDLNSDVNIRDGDGCTALYVALDEDEDEIAELLLKKGADPDVGNKDIGEDQTLLAWAASRRKISHVKLLLQHGTNPNLPGKSGMYPLHMAARIGAKNIIEILLSERADPTLEDVSGCTPKMIAEKNKKAVQAGCVELLEKAELSRA